jgi:hypothetical protein
MAGTFSQSHFDTSNKVLKSDVKGPAKTHREIADLGQEESLHVDVLVEKYLTT